MLTFLELDPSTASEGPWAKARLVSLPDYVRTLRIPGNFNWRRAVHTLLVHFRVSFLLPAADMLVHGKQQQEEAGEAGDLLEAVGGSPFVFAILRDALSPLHIYALGELTNLARAQHEDAAKEEPICLKKMLCGLQPMALPESLQDMPNPFVFSEHFDALLAELDPQEQPQRLQGKQMLDWLPGLADKPIGLVKLVNPYQERCSIILAVLLNKLASNSLPLAWRPAGFAKQTAVCMREGGPDLRTPEALLQALVEDWGASVDMQVASRITGFGLDFAVQEGQEWLPVPFATPVRTGITLLEGTAASSGTPEIMSLFTHAEVKLRITAPGHKFFRVSWYQGIEGFTGWHPSTEAYRPWNNCPEMELTHSQWGPKDHLAAMRHCTITACVVNRLADMLHLPNGGYGYLGVCNDSVAMVQAGMGAQITQWPCILAGSAKALLAREFMTFAEDAAQRGEGELADMAKRTRLGMLRNPCDVVHRPEGMLDAVRRVLAGIPPVTPFATLEQARGDLQRVREQLLVSGCCP